METPPGMVRRFWAPMARIGTGQHTSWDDMVLGERRRKTTEDEKERNCITYRIRKEISYTFRNV